jgi:general secretion pathway protein H
MSATGRTDQRRCPAGFTLVELLVVITLIGLVSGLAVLSMGDGRPSLGAEAERFAARLVRAREEAVLTNRTVEVEVTPQGYAFFRRRGGERLPLEDGPFGTELWEKDTRVGAGQVQEPATLAFDPTGAAGPFEVVLQRGADRTRVTVDSAGEVRVHASQS